MLSQDSSPIVAYFTDRDVADQCLRHLRSSGILNEQIGVSDLAETVITPANDPSVYRVVDQVNTSSDIQDYPHLDDVNAPAHSAYPIPVDRNFDSEYEAQEYEHPARGVMVSVSVEPTQRDEIRKVLHQFGGKLTDWPASNDKVA
jgi:hypothetical protein